MRKRDEPVCLGVVLCDRVELLDVGGTIGVVSMTGRVLPAIEAVTIAHAAGPVAFAGGSLATARRRCVTGLARLPAFTLGAGRKARSPAPPPLDRDHSPPFRSTPAAPDALLQVEHLGLRAEPEAQQKLRREQRDVMASDTIDLDEIAPTETLDPRQVQGHHSGVSVPGMF
jgi:hypothetical protein